MKMIFLNQMSGPLFRDLSEGVASQKVSDVVLFTGHPETVRIVKETALPNLKIEETSTYIQDSYFTRILSWVIFCFQSLVRIAKYDQKDLIVVSTNPPVMPFLIWMITRFKKNRFAVIVYDIFPDVLEKQSLIKSNGCFAKIFRWMNRVAYLDCGALITLNLDMKSLLSQSLMIAHRKIDVLEPWANPGHVAPISKDKNELFDKFGLSNKFVVLYAGNMGISHDIESILGAAKILTSETQIKFVFVGAGAKSKLVREHIAQNPQGNVRLLPPQAESVFPYVLNLADVSIASVDIDFENLMMPSKVFSYLAAGNAVIGITRKPSGLSQLLERNNCGVCVSPCSDKTLASVIQSLFHNVAQLHEMQLNARLCVEQKYNLDSGVERFGMILDKRGLVWRDG